MTKLMKIAFCLNTKVNFNMLSVDHYGVTRMSRRVPMCCAFSQCPVACTNWEAHFSAVIVIYKLLYTRDLHPQMMDRCVLVVDRRFPLHLPSMITA